MGLRDLSAYSLGYGAQANAYLLLLTDRYPNSDPDASGPEWSLPTHQLQLELSDDGRRSRLTVFFRLLLALPHFIWLTAWTVLAFLAAIVNGIVALVRGRSAEPLHRFLAAYVRYSAHVTAFITLVANPFPGFVGAPGFPVDISIGPPVRQNRWITLFRMFLVIPALIVSSALSGVLVVASILGWFAALAHRPDADWFRERRSGVRSLPRADERVLVRRHRRLPVREPGAPAAGRPEPEPEPELSRAGARSGKHSEHAEPGAPSRPAPRPRRDLGGRRVVALGQRRAGEPLASRRPDRRGLAGHPRPRRPLRDASSGSSSSSRNSSSSAS